MRQAKGSHMQISGSNYSIFAQTNRNTAPASTGIAAPKPDFSKLADYDSRDNIIFQNLLRNPTVQDNVVLNEDGTYSFIPGQGVQSEAEGVMRALIAEQNGDFYQSGQVANFSLTELAMFREMTGYNILQAGGGVMVVNDYGEPVSSEDRAMVEAAWQLFDTAKGSQEMENPGSEMTIDKLKDFAVMLRDGDEARSHLYEALLDLLDSYAETLAAQTVDDDALFGEP
jgi:hypothetical protein